VREVRRPVHGIGRNHPTFEAQARHANGGGSFTAERAAPAIVQEYVGPTARR
jgi:hypothetical protein